MPNITPDIEAFARIKVLGVGGSGGNAVNHMIASKVRGVDFIAINTDSQDLHRALTKKRIHIGKNITRGLGTGMNPDLGRRAVEETRDEIQEIVKGADMVFVTCGLGGGTGSGASPMVARVAKELGIPYDPGKLYEPDYNIQLGSWYIGRLLQKFKGQIPFGAGSFNSGPRPVMKWLDQYGDREVDELVELVPFTQTREYMKKVTENYARYRFLYANEVYEQPLTIDKQYLTNQLTY